MGSFPYDELEVIILNILVGKEKTYVTMIIVGVILIIAGVISYSFVGMAGNFGVGFFLIGLAIVLVIAGLIILIVGITKYKRY